MVLKFKINYLIRLILFLTAVQLPAQITTDRPDQTESSITVGRGNLQIESGFLIEFEGDEESSNRRILAPTTLFRYGISKAIELRFLNQFESHQSTSFSIHGISDIEIGTKVQLFKKQEADTEIAFISHLVLPTGTKELSDENYGTINKLSISHSLSERFGIGYNIGYNYFEESNGDLTYSLALGTGINEKVSIYSELYGAFLNFEDFEFNFDTGFTCLANEYLQFDFSFGTGLNKSMNYISIGASWLILKNKN
jgi:Putative MetA-pathway of phenol degradation